MPLDLGGFGISRYVFDDFLFKIATQLGVDVLINSEVESCNFREEKFTVTTSSKTLSADIVLGSFGKRSKVDISLNRNFIKKRSPYVGVKYHVRCDHPSDLISLHNFNGGYCGVSGVEDGKTNLCYLTHRDNLRLFKDIPTMEKKVLYENPLLRDIFQGAKFLFDKPEVINEISFATKSPVEDHILMVGDAAGMITPLCGNGMAMAIHGAKVASGLVVKFVNGSLSRSEMEARYTDTWNRLFKARLKRGRAIQNLFGNPTISNASVNLALHVRPLANYLMRNTHGDIF